MGRLVYGQEGIEIPVDDRPLAHLQVVIGSKLRRKESFFFSWTNSAATGSGRGTAWIEPAIPLLFLYSGNKTPQLNRDWLEMLLASANSSRGLRIVPEPGTPTTVSDGYS